jgi:hypothetical protein
VPAGEVLAAHDVAPRVRVTANRAGLLRLREQLDIALAADEGMASSATYRETDERRYDLFVQRADRREQMGEPREPERPDRSMLTKRLRQ